MAFRISFLVGPVQFKVIMVFAVGKAKVSCLIKQVCCYGDVMYLFVIWTQMFIYNLALSWH